MHYFSRAALNFGVVCMVKAAGDRNNSGLATGETWLNVSEEDTCEAIEGTAKQYEVTSTKHYYYSKMKLSIKKWLQV